MPGNNHLISILICNYNYGEFLEDTLESAINQDYLNTEIIIIDDHSTDNSIEVIDKITTSYPSKRIRLDIKQKNQGICYSRNDAIALAQGDYFIFLDSDDTIPVNYISNMYKIAHDRNADIVYGDEKTFDAESKISNHPNFSQKELLLHNYINVSSLVKKTSIKNHTFDIKLNHQRLEDYDFWVGLSLKELTFVKAKDTYLNYRIQGKSRNENVIDMKTQQLDFADIWHYIMIKYQSQFPDIVTQDIFFEEIKYQINTIGTELFNLNKVVQEELLPELERRSEHTQHQQTRIEHLESTNTDLLDIQKSASYRIGRFVTSPVRKIRSRK